MTDSGYPRTVYEWKRGTSLSEARKVFEGEKADVSVSGVAYLDRGHKYEMRVRSLTFYTSRYDKLAIILGSNTYLSDRVKATSIFTRAFLGCIDASDSESRLIFQLSFRSTRNDSLIT